MEEGEQGTEEQLNQFKYVVMKGLIRSEKNMEAVTKNIDALSIRSEKNMEEVTKNIDALRQEVRQLIGVTHKKL